MTFWEQLQQEIHQAAGIRVDAAPAGSIGGGCINSAFRLSGDGQDFFVKTNRASMADMFAAEAEGLNEIVASNTVHAPQAVCWGVAGDTAYIVLEYLPFGHGGSMARFGELLAAMHRRTHDRFGWHRDNTIGSTPQINTEAGDWIGFYRDKRLGYQYELGARNGFGGELARLGEQLMARLGDFFTGYRPTPSLLHGDLWSGNYAMLESGEPVIFDPAVYYGDREADLAMTELFGGFGREFYAAYRDAWPLDPGYETRKVLYNLYHILNHMNMFGGGYHGQALNMTERLLADVK